MNLLVQAAFLPILLVYSLDLQIGKGDDLLESPIFDYRPESKSLQDIQDGLNILKQKEEENNVQNEGIQIDKENGLVEGSVSDFRPGSKYLKKGKHKKIVEDGTESNYKTPNPNVKRIKQILSKFLSTLKRDKRKAPDHKHQNKKEKHKEHARKPRWQKWTDWSTCSVTCGKGRIIRWRHCQENCEVETEMEEISCQLPECPRKLFGLIKLN